MANVIYLARHAEPEYPNGRVCWLGRKIDVPLSTNGREQAGAIAARLRDENIAAVYTSPLLRTRETAAIIAGEAIKPRILPELIEMSSGEWEGMERGEIKRLHPEFFSSDNAKIKTPPGGESDAEGIARALTALRILSEAPEESIVAVTHAGLGRLLLCRLRGWDISKKYDVDMPCGSVTKLARIGDKWQVCERII